MIEAPGWFVWTFDLLLILAIISGLVFLKAWWNVRRTRGMIVAEIWEPNGDTSRTLVKPDPTGDTVIVDNLVYRLPKELSDKELKESQEKGVRVYPRKRWYYMSNRPLSPIPLRIESWERNNPEPIRPFYGRVDEKGMFIDSQLTVTASEWHIQKSAMKAAELGAFYQEMSTMAAVWQRAMANLPNKIVVYVGLGIAALGSIIAVVILYQIAMG